MNLRLSPKPSRILARRLTALLASAGVLAPFFASAANGDWISTAATAGWGTATNWSTNPTVPGSVAGDVVNFNSDIAANASITLDANRIVGTLLVGDANTTNSFALTGNTLTLDQTGTATALVRFGVTGSTGNIANSITSAITLADNARFYSTLAGVQTLGGIISGAFSVTYDNDDGTTLAGPASGLGQFSIGGANTYSLGTTIDDVRVNPTAAAALGTGAVTVQDGGQVYVSTAITVANAMTINGNGWQETAGQLGAIRVESGTLSGAITLGSAASIGTNSGTGTVSGIISGGFGLSKAVATGTGTLVLSGANTFTGNVVVNGTSLAAGASTLRVTTSNLALGAGNAVTLNTGTGAGGQGTTLELQSSLTWGTGKTLTMNSNNAGDLRSTLLNGAGNNTWAGPIVLAGNGFIQLNAASATTLTITGGITSTGGGGIGTVVPRGAGTVALNGIVNLGSDRGFIHTDTGTVIVNSTGNSWLSTQVSDGQIQIGANNALPAVDFSLGQNSATNGRLELNGFNQTIAALRTFSTSTGTTHIIRNSNITNSSTLTFNNVNTEVLKNTLIQPGGFSVLNLVKNGAGRFEIQDGRVDNASLVVNAGTLAFTGTTERAIRPDITGVAGVTIDHTSTGSSNFIGAFNNTGSTTVTAGRLNLGNGTAGDISVGSSGTLGAGLNGGRLSAFSLSFSPGATFTGILGGTNTPLVSAALVTNVGTTTINVEAPTLTIGTYKLIGYGGATPFGSFTLGSMPHMSATLVDSGTSVDLNVTDVNTLVWVGTTAVWDVNNTQNFKLASNGSAAPFFQSDSVLFDDTGATKAITVSGGPRIGNLTFNNSTGNDYTVTGVLAGPGGITKSGNGQLTLASANTFTGPINVTGGTLLLNAANTGHGAVTVTGGTLKLGNADAISSGALVTVSSGGTIDVNGQAPNIRIPEIHISGAGVNNGGAVVNNSATGLVNVSSFGKIVLDGDVSWGGAQRNDVPGNTLFAGNNFVFTKVGAGDTWFQGSLLSAPSGIIVNGGTFGVQTTNPLPAGTSVTVNNGAFHSVFSAVGVQHPVILNDGGTFRSTNSTPTANGSVTLNGTDANRFLAATTGTTLNIAGRITGPGGFTKNDAGTVTIQNASNDYAGDTKVAAGTLTFNATGQIPVTTNLIVDGGIFGTANIARTVGSLSGLGGTISGGNTLTSTQSTTTTWAGVLSSTTLAMNGPGSLTLAGTADNGAGIGIANSGTLILAKAAADLTAHVFGSGLTINSGAIVQLGGSASTLTGTVVNLAPTGAVVGQYVDQIYNNIPVALNTGGVLDLNGRSEAVQAVTGGGTIRNTVVGTTRRLYIGSPGGTVINSTFAGVIEDGGGVTELEKLGATTLTLSGTNTYSGATVLTTGTLNVTGSIAASTVAVATGTTLTGPGAVGGVTLSGTYTGSGSVTGAFVSNNGSTVSIGGNNFGNTATTISAGSLTFGAGATRTISLDFTGTAVDRVNTTAVNGLTLDGTSNVTVVTGPSGWVTGTYPVYTYNPTGTVQGAGASSLVLQNPTGHNTVSFVDDHAGNVNLSIAATTNKWVGGVVGQENTWDINTTANWNSADQKFLNGDNVLFDDTATAGAYSPTIAANVTPASVTFNNTANSYALNGVAGVTGAGGLTKTGNNTLTLNNPNTYTGQTAVQNGTLVANYSVITPIAPASLFNVSANGTLRLQHNGGVFNLANPLAGSGTVIIDPSAATTGARDFAVANVTWDASAFTGTLDLKPTLGSMRLTVDALTDLGGALVKVENGGQIFTTTALTFPQNFNLTGTGFSEGAGTLGAIRAGAANTIFSGTITVPGAAKIGTVGGSATATGTINGGGVLTFGGSINNASAETLNITGDASGLGGLVVNDGSGTSNAANIMVSVGTGGTTGTIGSVPVTLRGDGFKIAIVRFDRTDGYTLGAPITSTGTTGNTLLQIDTQGGFSTAGNAVNLGGGGVRIGNLRNGALAQFDSTVTTGSIIIGVLNASATTKNAVLNLASGANVTAGSVSLGGGGGTAPLGNTSGAVLNVAPGATLNATATLFLGDQNTSTGLVNQTGGTVTVGQQLRIGHWPNETSTYTLSGGSLTITNGNTATNPSNTTEFNGGLYVGIDGVGIMNHSNGTFTTDWVVLDNRADTAGTDQYNLSGGVLAVRMTYGIIRRNATAQFNFSGGTIRNAGSAVSANIDTPLTLTGTTATIDTNGATNAFNVIQAATGAGTLTKVSNGTLNLNAASTGWTGNLVVTGGTVATSTGSGGLGSFNTPGRLISASGGSTISLGTNNVLGNGVGNPDITGFSLDGATLASTRYNPIGPVTLSNGATLTQASTDGPGNFEGFQFLGNITVSGTSASTITTTNGKADHLNANTIFTVGDVTGSAAVDLVVSAPLKDQSGDFGNAPGGFTKEGAGTMQLTVGSSYTGATTVNAGTLLVNGSISGSTTTVNTNGTLGGNGPLGPVILAGGTLAPGNSPGIMSTANLTLSGGTTSFEINGTTPGTGYDQVAVTGSVTFTANTALTVNLGTFDPANGDSFTLIANDTNTDPIALGGFKFTYLGTPLANGQAFTVGSEIFTINYAGGDGNDVVLTSVPEPGAILLVAGGLGMLLAAQRRRRSS